MSDTEQVIDSLGIFGPQSEEPEEQPDAAETTATPTDADDSDEEMTLDELEAGLAGEAAPDTTAAPGTEPPTDAADETATPEVAELLRQLDEYKAKEAEVKAAQADAEFLAPWENQQAVNDAFFDAEVRRIHALGKQEGRTQDEIDLAIYRRVELGIDFGIQRRNPQTGQMELLGRIDADAELAENLRMRAIEYERGKTRPDAFEQLVTQYTLDATDRVALAKFRNYPPEHLKEIAATLGAKNQRATQTHQQIRNDAVANVRSSLSRTPAPGTPGQAPAKKPYVYKHTPDVARRETEALAMQLGVWRPGDAR